MKPFGGGAYYEGFWELNVTNQGGERWGFRGVQKIIESEHRKCFDCYEVDYKNEGNALHFLSCSVTGNLKIHFIIIVK